MRRLGHNLCCVAAADQIWHGQGGELRYLLFAIMQPLHHSTISVVMAADAV